MDPILVGVLEHEVIYLDCKTRSFYARKKKLKFGVIPLIIPSLTTIISIILESVMEYFITYDSIKMNFIIASLTYFFILVLSRLLFHQLNRTLDLVEISNIKIEKVIDVYIRQGFGQAFIMILFLLCFLLFFSIYLVDSNISDLFVSSFLLLSVYTIKFYYNPLKKIRILKNIGVM